METFSAFVHAKYPGGIAITSDIRDEVLRCRVHLFLILMSRTDIKQFVHNPCTKQEKNTSFQRNKAVLTKDEITSGNCRRAPLSNLGFFKLVCQLWLSRFRNLLRDHQCGPKQHDNTCSNNSNNSNYNNAWLSLLACLWLAGNRLLHPHY